MNKIIKILKNPMYLLVKLDNKGIIRLNDELYLKLKYKWILEKKLNLKEPSTFNEKLQWMKINYKDSKYSDMVDKYKAKEIVKKIEIENDDIHIIPTLGIYNKFDEINFEELPQQFVIKCTHDSGSYKIIKNKNNIDYEKLKKYYNKKLNQNFYYDSREWPYKNIKPKIIIEKFMDDTVHSELVDYKFQCFYGKVDNIFVCVDRDKESGVKYHYFDKNWKYLNYCPYPGINERNINIAKPKYLDRMLEIVERLAAGIPEVRVDLYIIDEKIYFGEFTFFTDGGFDTTITENADKIIGNRFKLPAKNK